MNTREEVQRLFDSFGKNPREGQFNAYLEWAILVDEFDLPNVIARVIKTEERLPPLSSLYAMTVKKKPMYVKQGEECYFCSDTGYVPRIFDDKEEPYLRMMACKCSSAVKGCQPYFEVYKEVQFKPIDELSYMQVVDRHLRPL